MLHSVLKSSSCRWWVVGFLGSDSAFLLSFCFVHVCVELSEYSQPDGSTIAVFLLASLC